MEIKVRHLGEVESKSTQELEKELLEKHESQQEGTVVKEENVIDKVNLQIPPKVEEKIEKVEEPVVEQEEEGEVPEEEVPVSTSMSEEDVLSFITKRYGEEVTSLDDLIKKREASEELPEDVKAYFDYKKETGRSIEDYVRLHEKFDDKNPDSIIASYYAATEEGLDSEDIKYLMDEKFGVDEDLDDAKEKRKKELAKKRELSKAKKFFNEQKDKYKLPLESREALSTDVQEKLEAYGKYIDDIASEEEVIEKKLDWFEKETNKVFNKDFKGFEFVINDKKMSYLPGSVAEVKKSGSTINNFISKFIGEDGLVMNTAQYHKALSMAQNPEKYAKFFYEQGQADAVEDMSKKTKNIKMDVRSSPQVTAKSGFKVRSLSHGSSRGLKIRSINKNN
tara:strand:- start:3858 stop:5036 length:1179 start_codon:yes stop_codon:yes gene_type:complete